jgi:hypothetical protein
METTVKAVCDRAEVMKRAWQLFRERYAYPKIAFSSIGRHCFDSCLKAAWQEAKERACYASIPPAERGSRIERLKWTLDLCRYSDARNGGDRAECIRAEISKLEAAAA